MGITRKRDLRDGAPVWSSYDVPKLSGTTLRRSLRTEVAIIGAGISGAMIAQSLTEMGIRTVILERRSGALLGSTAASTALLQFELDMPLIKLIQSIGRRRAEKVWIASRDAVNELRTRTHRLKIEAALHSRPSLYLAGNALNARDLKREVAERQKIGLASEYLDRQALKHHFGIHRPAAILNHGNAEANPVQLAAGYLGLALKSGARLFRSCEVVDIECGRRGSDVLLQNGLEVHARHVVFCTGYEMLKIIPAGGNRVFSTWAIATRSQPQSLWPQKALIWEASEPYLYARATADGRVICGGEDEKFADADKRDALTPVKTRRIEAKLHRLFPDLDPRAAASWTGSFGGSPNGMPTIGPIPGFRKCYAVMGYGGNGITFSMLATKLICAMISGRKAPDASLFGFN